MEPTLICLTITKLHLQAKTIIKSKKKFIHHIYRLVYCTIAKALKHWLLLLQFSWQNGPIPFPSVLPIQCSISIVIVQQTLTHMVVFTNTPYHNNLVRHSYIKFTRQLKPFEKCCPTVPRPYHTELAAASLCMAVNEIHYL